MAAWDNFTQSITTSVKVPFTAMVAIPTVKAYDYFYRPMFILFSYFLTIPTFLIGIFFLTDANVQGHINFVTSIIGLLVLGAVAIILPIFIGLGGRTIVFSNDKISLSEKSVVFFGNICNRTKDYQWTDIMGWNIVGWSNVTVMQSSAVQSTRKSVECLRLYFNDGIYLVGGKSLYVEGEVVDGRKFIDTLMPRLKKIKPNRKYFDRRNLVDEFQHYTFIALIIIAAIWTAVVIAIKFAIALIWLRETLQYIFSII